MDIGCFVLRRGTSGRLSGGLGRTAMSRCRGSRWTYAEEAKSSTVIAVKRGLGSGRRKASIVKGGQTEECSQCDPGYISTWETMTRTGRERVLTIRDGGARE